MALSEEIERFLRDHVDSIEQLEVMLLLHAQPSRSWTGESAARELRLDPVSVERHLESLVPRGIAVRESDGCITYARPTGELGRVLGHVAAAYRTQRTAVISYVLSKPNDKVQTFADAFRLRRGS